MRPEDRLNHIIEQRENGENKPLLLDDETMPLVAAAEGLTQLRKIDVPSQFAQKLEGEIRARARAQKLSEQSQSGKLIPFVPPQRFARPTHSLSRQTWVAIIACVALLLIISASLLTVSMHNVPRDPLVGKAQQTAIQETAVSTTATPNRANAAIQQLHSSIVNLSTVVNEKRSDNAIHQALNAVSTWTSTSQEQVAALPASPELSTIQQNLATEIGKEKQTLHLLLGQVDWPLKVIFTHQLGLLGEPVPTVTSVAVHAQTQNSEAFVVTLTGSHFSPYAHLVVDGKLTGNISQSTAKRLVAIINPGGSFSGTHTLGILNPDGTAAQMIFKSPENVNDSSTSTPTLTPMPTQDTTPTPTQGTTPTPTPTHHPDG